MHARVLSLVVAVLTMAAATSLEALPDLLRNELLQKHAQGKVKHDSTGRPWSAAMDAWDILRHKHDGASFAVLAGEEASVADRRTKGAINRRWTTHLKILPSIQTVCDMRPRMRAMRQHAKPRARCIRGCTMGSFSGTPTSRAQTLTRWRIHLTATRVGT